MIEITKMVNKTKTFTLNIEDLVIDDGQKIALLGKNGAGKTTFVETLLKLRNSQNYDVNFSKDYAINSVFQDAHFENNFSVKEILQVWGSLHKKKLEDLEVLIDQFELKSIWKIKYRKLSSGQKQKVKICVALINNPDLLILDELTTALDVIWQKKIIILLNQYFTKHPQAILLYISHNFEEVVQLCQKIIFLEAGEIKYQLPIKNNKEELERTIWKELYD